MPVSLDDMMGEMRPDARAAIERNASAMTAEYRLERGQAGSEARDLASAERGAVGTKVTTGQPCPESGIWKVENTTSATVPVAIHTRMPPYGNQAVTWVLIRPA